MIPDNRPDGYYTQLVTQRGYPEAYRLVVDEVTKLRRVLTRIVNANEESFGGLASWADELTDAKSVLTENETTP